MMSADAPPAAGRPAPSEQQLCTAEALQLAKLAGPIILTYLLAIGVQVVVQMIVGHVSADALAAAALATMFAHAFGLSLIFGSASACDTLCSQAFGARNYPRVGAIAYQGSIIGLCIVSICCIGWFYLAGPFFGLMQQDTEIAQMAQQYIRLLMWGLPAKTVFETMKKPLNSANLPLPPLLFSALGLACSATFGYLFVYATPLSFWGAPIACSVADWVSLVSLLLYLRFHRAFHLALEGILPAAWVKEFSEPSTAAAAAPAAALAPSGAAAIEGERVGASGGLAQHGVGTADVGEAIMIPLPHGDAASAAASTPAAAPAVLAAAPPTIAAHPSYHDLLDQLFPLPELATVITLETAREYITLGAPGALMLFIEWGSYEALSLIAGTISRNVLAAQAIMATTATLSFMPFLGFSVACCIRVGNFLGELHPEEARRSYRVTLAISGVLIAMNTFFVLALRNSWGLMFTDDLEVSQLVSNSLFILCAYTLFDGIQCVCTGALKGVSMPTPAAAINLLSYVAIGLPLAYYLATPSGAMMGLSGIWLGFVLAVLCAALCMTTLLFRISWEAKSQEAFERAKLEGGGAAPLGGH